MNRWQLYVDGAARNNPGPAGAGIYILKNNEPVAELGVCLGTKTNNQAEYLALLLGLLMVKKLMGQEDALIIKSDSELLVRQLTGVYSVKNKDLVRLAQYAKGLLAKTYSMVHIPRSENKVADRLANKGIDKKIPIPEEFLPQMCLYEKAS